MFLGELSEEPNFLLAGWLPLIIRFECALQVRFDIDIKRLRLQMRVRRVIHAWNCLGRCQVVKVASEFGELRAGTLLLPLELVLS